jgi:hypothetical protein
MAEGGIGTAVTILKYGVAVYEFLKEINDDTVKMKCQFPEDRKDNKIIFTAYNHRTFLVSLITFDPWATNIRGYDKNPNAARETPKKFKIIEIVCDNKEEFRLIHNKYQGSSEIKQYDVIQYLKYVASRYANIKISMAATCIDTKRSESGGPTYAWHEWEEWKLTITIQ